MKVAAARCRIRIFPALAWTGLVLAGLLLPGCESPGGSAQGGVAGPPADPVQHPLLQNIPLPVNFRMVPERSVARAAVANDDSACPTFSHERFPIAFRLKPRSMAANGLPEKSTAARASASSSGA